MRSPNRSALLHSLCHKKPLGQSGNTLVKSDHIPGRAQDEVVKKMHKGESIVGIFPVVTSVPAATHHFLSLCPGPKVVTQPWLRKGHKTTSFVDMSVNLTHWLYDFF